MVVSVCDGLLFSPPPFGLHISHLQPAVAGGNLGELRINASKLGSLAVSKVIHRRLGKVETARSVVNGEDIDCLPVVCDAVASAALIKIFVSHSWFAVCTRFIHTCGEFQLAMPSYPPTRGKEGRAPWVWNPFVRRPLEPSEQETAVKERLASS